MMTAEARTTDPGVDARLPLRLLVVDDDPLQRKMLEQAARLAGCDVISAASHREAVRCIETSPFDCVILDLQLEDGDGIDLCRILAQMNYAGSTIIISGADAARRSSARAFARTMGIETQGLPKPVDLASLRICLANLSKDLRGLPAVHAWGGTASDQIIENHRAENGSGAERRNS